MFKLNIKIKTDMKFKDILLERRKDVDILWASRSTEPLLPHMLSAEAKYTRDKIIEKVLQNDKVKLMINTVALKRHVDKSVIEKEAYSMVHEMASKAHLPTVRWIGYFMTKVVKRMFLSIYINETALLELKRQMQISQVQYIYVPSHRSYLDFVLFSYILFSYDMALPNIASGMDFYQMYIVGELLRKTGAFYMRRTFSTDQLYKEVFRAYINAIVTHSDRAIEFFIEGTRSRNQKSILPKYGLLSIILESFVHGNVPDIQFVPISISYDRPPEELLFVYELLGVPKPKESTAGLLKSLSILQKPQGHGNVFFNFGETISARDFIDINVRREIILNPYKKLPNFIIEDLAYSIIESHKKNTVLTVINLVALLLNNRIQNNFDMMYTLDDLVVDYIWCKNLFMKYFETKIVPECNSLDESSAVKEEILKSLKVHEDLIVLDKLNQLRVKQRYEGKTDKSLKVKGHSLTEEAKRVAVSAINIAIYVNPTLAFLIKPAIIVASLKEHGLRVEEAFEQYTLLRTLLSTEFALQTNMNKSQIKIEWEEILKMLIEENCLLRSNNVLYAGNNVKLFILLNNTIIPFIDAALVTCSILFEWDEMKKGNATQQEILIESQKRVERAILNGQVRCQHPYCLTLDLFISTLQNLSIQGIVVQSRGSLQYTVDKVMLAKLINVLENLPGQRPPFTYREFLPLYFPYTSTHVQAKL
ncbi:dihydroxyacetone phosphate acyltransferase [Prorops nasuta]|uniref:dihydroxyacetone phosphate acyltransferase n=1 Tax=Prorops nasuta TaxID=863751 RepID=UPI0034CDB593